MRSATTTEAYGAAYESFMTALRVIRPPCFSSVHTLYMQYAMTSRSSCLLASSTSLNVLHSYRHGIRRQRESGKYLQNNGRLPKLSHLHRLREIFSSPYVRYGSDKISLQPAQLHSILKAVARTSQN